jgi:DNA-3-methyladenine glycosylase
MPRGWSGAFDAPLPRSAYERPTRTVARALLGAFLVRREPTGDRVARIVETEAYVANDPASHAFRGPTERNRSMFSRPGTLYVYRIHQVHCANAVTRPGQAVLLRAAEPVVGRFPAPPRGPGRLCWAFDLARADDGLDLVTSDRLRIVPGPAPEETIVLAPRIGIRLAAERPLRFALSGNLWVSTPLPWPRVRRGAPAPGKEIGS